MAPTRAPSPTASGGGKAKRSGVLYIRNCPEQIKKHLESYAKEHDISVGQAALEYIDACIKAGGLEREIPKPRIKVRH